MHVHKLLCPLIFLPSLAMADIEPVCEELWFSRNAMLDDAGQCFSSTLGRSIFDNSDCTTQAPAISPDVARQIAIIRILEQNAPYAPDGQCRVDVSRTSLTDMQYPDLRRQLTFHPATDGAASSCIGYRGVEQALHAGPYEDAEVIGHITSGASVSMSHLPWNGWSFAIVQQEGQGMNAMTLGWYRGDITGDLRQDGTSTNCTFIAG